MRIDLAPYPSPSLSLTGVHMYMDPPAPSVLPVKVCFDLDYINIDVYY